MSALDVPGSLDAAHVHVPLEPVPAELVLDGEPRWGTVVLGEVEGAELGVWELTPGTMTDSEVDEVFVVLSGEASVTLPDGEVLALGPGSVGRLAAGLRTRWVVTRTLRKVYLAQG